jgi:type IV secretion system protein TrbE
MGLAFFPWAQSHSAAVACGPRAFNGQRQGPIVVIDDGSSWMTTCHRLDPRSRPIIVRANGDQTFNIFDTRGLPLTPEHLASATALCHLLLGKASDEDRDKLRAAVLAEAISQLYGTAYRAWRKDNPQLHFCLCREVAALLKFQEARGIDSFSDAFLEARAFSRACEEGLMEFEEGIGDASALALDRDPATQDFVRNMAFAKWMPAMFSTLSDLQDELHSCSHQRGPHQELCGILASLLRPWLRDGSYGRIVDGPSNIDLGAVDVQENDPLKVVHFELEKIGKAETELRAIVGFLITNAVRNHI